MERGNYRAPLRSKSVCVEEKLFEFVVFASGLDKVSITEKGNNGTFKGNMSLESRRWLGKLLCQASLEDYESGTAFRFVEKARSVTGTVRRNKGGSYLQLVMVAQARKKSYSTLCFPAGNNRQGWSVLGTTIRSLVDNPAPPPYYHQPQPKRQTESYPAKAFNVSYADACGKTGGTENRHHRVQVNSRGGMLHASWWFSSVICSTDCISPDWNWVQGRINSIFHQPTVKILDKGGALIFLTSETDVNKIINMPPLFSWNGSYNFHKWSPDAGSINLSSDENEVRVLFYGIPLHLRATQVVESLAKYCGRVVQIVDGSVTSHTQQSSAIIVVKDLESIPRKINLEERGYIFSVWVMVDFPRLIGDDRVVNPNSVSNVQPMQ
ncbi:hypothetical protein FRX31_023505 [Thalictrum thalictroides]|uniref:Uncharacterized protein n=1 Tax=Thalictrum thalictroides TaxID=46969 RepID=A0A7J6VQP9_THATH|nr:hypothetical protein FRX31_023505 [Thalictrum thalictroides]